MGKTGTKFLVGFLITISFLIFVTTVYIDIPLEPMLIMVFLFVSAIVGIMVSFSHKHGLHAGHSTTLIGFIMIIAFGTLVSGAVDLTYQGETREKMWEIPQNIFNLMVVGLGFGVGVMVLGMYVSWKKWVKN